MSITKVLSRRGCRSPRSANLTYDQSESLGRRKREKDNETISNNKGMSILETWSLFYEEEEEGNSALALQPRPLPQ